MSLGALGGTRTPGLLLRRQLLYPAELLAHIYAAAADDGAGDGNRTHVTSLEGWNSTIELHPQDPGDYITPSDCNILSDFRPFVNGSPPFPWNIFLFFPSHQLE